VPIGAISASQSTTSKPGPQSRGARLFYLRVILEAVKKQIWNTKEVGEFLGRSPAAVRNLVLRRCIPYRKLAGRLIFLKSEMEEWIHDAPGISINKLKSNNEI